MTNTQTEARAIALAAAGQVHDNEGARCVETLVERLVATALAAKDAELAEVKAQLQRQFDQTVRFQGYLVEAKAQLAEADRALASEETRSAELLKRLDKARSGAEPDFCYDPEEWEFTCSWDDRDQVHGYGDNLPLGGVMQVATLIRGPRKWVAHVPVTWDEDGDPDDTRIEWFDSEDAARSAREAQGGNNG